MTRWLRWLWMLSKRLYKRPAFLAILVLIPVAVVALRTAAEADSGFLHVVLTQTNPDDPISSAIISDFMEEDSLVRFSYVDDPRTATDMVIGGEADAAWVFPDDMQQQINKFVKTRSNRGFVTVVMREQTILSRVANEKLNFALQEYASRACYLEFTRDNVEALNRLTDEELMAYYNEVEFNEELFLFRSSAGDASSQPETNYLTAPVRGLLGMLMVLCGLAAALFYCQDKARGTFALVPERKHSIVAFACLFIAVLNVSIVVLAALLAGGVATFWVKELLVLLLYDVCCAAFCLLMLRLFGSMRGLAAVLPLLVMAMVALCPIFFDLRSMITVQMLFPPTYFVNAGHDDRWLLYMLGYTMLCLGLTYGVDLLGRFWRRMRGTKTQ